MARIRDTAEIGSLRCIRCSFLGRSAKVFLQTVVLAVGFGQLVATVKAEDAKAEPSPAKVAPPAAEGPVKLLFPNPYPQFLSLQIQLVKAQVKPDWDGMLDRHQQGGFEIEKYKDADAALPMLTGIRLADGMVAVMAHDADTLRSVAEEVENLAEEMGVDREKLKSGDGVRKAALEGDWARVVWELSFLQAEVMDYLNGGKTIGAEEPRAILAAFAAFLQAGVYAADLVGENQNKVDLSNFMRPGRYIDSLIARKDRLPPDLLNSSRVQICIRALNIVAKKVDIPMNGVISAEDIGIIRKTAQEALDQIVTP